MRKIFLCIIVCYVINSSLTAQVNKSTDNINQVWLGYLNQTRLSDRWGIWADLHLRTKENFVDNFSQSIIRLGLTYYVTDATKLTAGYAYISLYPTDAQKVTQPEHRPWQQVQWNTKYGKKRMMQRFRLEERYRRKILNDSTLADGHNFNFRMRYYIWYDIPLSKKGIVSNSISFVVNEEVNVNFGKQIVNNYFDQNRFFAGFKYQLDDHNNIQFGYMNLFQQLPAGNKYRSVHAARLFYFQTLDMRKNKSKQ